jgi:hypothetical protein
MPNNITPSEAIALALQVLLTRRHPCLALFRNAGSSARST